MDMVVKDNSINKQNFRTRQLLTGFISARDCERLILYGAIHVWGKRNNCLCSVIVGKKAEGKKYIKTHLNMQELKTLFTSIMRDSSVYSEESLMMIKNTIIKNVNVNYYDTNESKEILFDVPFEFHAQTEYERDYGWEYYRDEIIKQGNQWGDTRPFYILGIIVDDFYKSRYMIDEDEPRYGIFEVINTIKKDGNNKKRRIYNVDFDLKNRKNKEIGDLGELIIIDYEKSYLRRMGKPDLADKVVSTKETLGNVASFDILSYTRDGNEKYIEVKTTEKGVSDPFFLSAAERKYAKAKGDSYYLYRIFNLNKITKKYKLMIIDDLLSSGNFEISQYKVTI